MMTYDIKQDKNERKVDDICKFYTKNNDNKFQNHTIKAYRNVQFTSPQMEKEIIIFFNKCILNTIFKNIYWEKCFTVLAI